MSLIRRIARPALAAPFIFQGVRTAISPEREIEIAPSAFAQLDKTLESSQAPGFVDARAVLRVSGAVAATAGLAYASGKAPRAAAGVLLLTTSVGLAGRKKIWELRGEERLDEIKSLLSDVGLLGGVMIAVLDREGRPSLGYQWGQFVEHSQKQAEQRQRKLSKKAGKVSEKAGEVSKKAGKKADDVTKQAQKASQKLAQQHG
ncbi:hypothetical protein [Brachybacterium endophyticum]|uniref:hypothetical protein n=1 Tax=Brachybacterium endophyticum TaxID=2182385 RepID=UPI001F0C4FA8|nr:hypothetical protein [Brachybacterium endophyticum]